MKLRIVFLLALILLSGIITTKPEDTSDPDHPFAKHLTSLYTEYLDAAKKGDVLSAVDKMISEYSNISSNITPQTLKSMCDGELDPRESHFIKVDTKDDMARVVYMKDIEYTTNWQVVVFKLESGRWKISRIVRHEKNKDSEDDILALLLKDTNFFKQDDN